MEKQAAMKNPPEALNMWSLQNVKGIAAPN